MEWRLVVALHALDLHSEYAYGKHVAFIPHDEANRLLGFTTGMRWCIRSGHCVSVTVSFCPIRPLQDQVDGEEGLAGRSSRRHPDITEQAVAMEEVIAVASLPARCGDCFTRGKKLVVFIGQKKALAMAVRNNQTENRFSGLLERVTSVAL